MASIAQTAVQIALLVKRVIDLINLSNANRCEPLDGSVNHQWAHSEFPTHSKHMKEIKSRMQSIAGILDRLSKLPDGDREDLEQSIVSAKDINPQAVSRPVT